MTVAASTFVLAATSNWRVTLGVAAVPAIASVIAAVLSARSARKSRLAEMDAARISELESRLSERKYDLYKPMIDLLREMLDSSKSGKAVDQTDMQKRLSEFGAWIGIFGSDDAIRTFRNFMQGAYHSAPAPILMRLYAEFILSARRDLGYQDSSITPQDLLGIRITDLYQSPTMKDVSESDFADLCQRHGWDIPWKDAQPGSR